MTRLDAIDHSPEALDPYSDDPFFKRHADSSWNACIGEQGDEENYVDGYIEAAMELANDIINKKMYGKRDTLVLPILYNTRHAVELLLKFITARLIAAGLLPREGRPHHKIKTYWDGLNAAALGDEQLSRMIDALKPFVNSLSRIDDDGQELRFHLNRFSDPSLADYSLANLEVIRASLTELSEIISILKNRVLCFIEERRTGLFTERCSRHDLLAIAQFMPRREFWATSFFDQQKAAVKARFKLSNKEFSDALNAIQSSRATKAIIGLETDLLYLSDDDIVWIAEQWRRVHPASEEVSNLLSSAEIDDAFLEAMMKEDTTRTDVVADISERIAADKLAEIETIYYLGRDGIFPEYYEQRVENAKKKHAVENDVQGAIVHLIDKTNLLRALRLAAPKIGRLFLATRLATL